MPESNNDTMSGVRGDRVAKLSLRGGARLGLGSVVLVVVLAACGATMSQSDRAAVDAWLGCGECVAGELDSVVALQNRAVASLGRGLEGLSADERRNIRRRFAASYTRLVAYKGVDSVRLSEAEFVGRFLSNYEATRQVKAAVALGSIGTASAVRELQDALARDSSGVQSVRGDVQREVLAKALFHRLHVVFYKVKRLLDTHGMLSNVP